MLSISLPQTGPLLLLMLSARAREILAVCPVLGQIAMAAGRIGNYSVLFPRLMRLPGPHSLWRPRRSPFPYNILCVRFVSTFRGVTDEEFPSHMGGRRE